MDSFAIVVVTYNRLKSLERLLKSLNDADYNTDCVPLIISIDFSGTDDVYNLSQEFEWNHGEKIIRTFKERQGLRNHILQCGSYTENYEAIAVFEDDIYVSTNFYKYSKQAIKFYKEDDNIAGISLYSFEKNYNNGLPFTPRKNEFDNYFLNIAQSWGQIWMRDKWSKFIEWYKDNDSEFKYENNLPQSICSWPKSSWLKYHTRYCIEMNKYFVYPYYSLSTNFGDSGEHHLLSNNSFQVSIQSGTKNVYNFSPFNRNAVVYDAFFEPLYIGECVNIKDSDLCFDLYGDKNNLEKKRYWFTLKKLNFEIIKSYGLSLRPHEQSIIHDIVGSDIFLYDTLIEKKFVLKTNYPINKFIYFQRTINEEYIVNIFKTLIYFIKIKFFKNE